MNDSKDDNFKSHFDEQHTKCMEINHQIIQQLQKGRYIDLSDIGNIIGMTIGKHPTFNNENGFDLESFIAGVEHGVSVVKGIE